MNAYTQLCTALDIQPPLTHRAFWEYNREWLNLCDASAGRLNSNEMATQPIVCFSPFEVSLYSNSNFLARLKPYAINAFQEKWALWFKTTPPPPVFMSESFRLLYQCKFSQVQILLEMKKNYLLVRFRCCLVAGVEELTKKCQIFRYLFWKAVIKNSGHNCECCLLNKNNFFWQQASEKVSKMNAKLLLRNPSANKTFELRKLVMKHTEKADNLALFLSQRSKTTTDSGCIFRVPGTVQYSQYWNSKPCSQSGICGGLILGSTGTGKTRSMLALFLDGSVWHCVRDTFFDVYVYSPDDVFMVQNICCQTTQALFLLPGQLQQFCPLILAKTSSPERTKLVICSSDIQSFLAMQITTDVMVLDTDVLAVPAWPSEQSIPSCLFVVSNVYSLSLVTRLYKLWNLNSSFGVPFRQLRRDVRFDLIASVTYLFTFSDLFSEGQDVGEFELVQKDKLSDEDENLVFQAVIACCRSGDEYCAGMLMRLLTLIESGERASINHLSRVCIRFLAAPHQNSNHFALLYNCSALLEFGPAKQVTECCSICQDTCASPIQVQTCNHIFCYECIYQWNMINSTCPLCVQKFQHNGFYKVPGHTYDDSSILQARSFTSKLDQMVQQTLSVAATSPKPVLICCQNPEAISAFAGVLGDSSILLQNTPLRIRCGSTLVCPCNKLKRHSQTNKFKTVINFDGNQTSVIRIATGFRNAKKVHMYVKGLPSFNIIFNLFQLVDPFYFSESKSFQLRNLFTS